MPAPQRRKSSCVNWISSAEMARIVDTRAQSVLKVSGDQFMSNRAQGKYAYLDADDCPGIVELALLAPSVKEKTSLARKKS